ncbi:MAG: Glycosyl transferases group 1 [Candidatus Argoarchaeum ethanivorans]|uniref:Glycosyl transferases group 1 n=1 Tax=Candidatus Argoarchaeum ethanivorans TaxID=2608793 RepID=A0A811T6N6_9EURY|nr:MAG: Glycosyl transferases group 1 [Candidatus Argoarchaeum ethanivorans]
MGNKIKIGFYIKWSKGSLNSKMNVLGDELLADSMCRALLKNSSVESCELYAPNYLPDHKLDVMIYLNDTKPNSSWAAKHVLYLQNAYGEGSGTILKKMQQLGYDGYAFISERLHQIHRRDEYPGIFLPFGVDTEIFYPRELEPEFTFDVAYVGNDIKGEYRTNKYLFPATKFNFGLFGNWNIPHARFYIWKNWQKQPEYRKIFEKLSRGKIPQEKVSILYSSTKINLNCTAQDCVDWDVITLRTYEVLACKGFLITDKTPVAEKTMQKCMVFTDGDNDLVEKIEYYLNHKDERQRIAQQGYEYAIKCATIDARMNELVNYLEEIL